MTNFNTLNKTPMEVSLTEDNSHFERDLIQSLVCSYDTRKMFPLLMNFSELFSKNIELSQNYIHSLTEMTDAVA